MQISVSEPFGAIILTPERVCSDYFLVLGLLTLAAYMEVGYEHQDRAGERYQPAAYSQLNSASQGGNH